MHVAKHLPETYGLRAAPEAAKYPASGLEGVIIDQRHEVLLIKTYPPIYFLVEARPV